MVDAEPPRILYISDLDGTLLNRAGELSPGTRRVLHELLEEGILFTVASARSYFSIRSLLRDLPLSLPVIEFNGAFLTDYQSGVHIETNSLGRDLGECLFDHIVKGGLRPFVNSYNGREDCLHYDQLVNQGMVWYEARRRGAGDPRLRKTIDLRSTMTEEVVSLTVMDHDEGRIRELHLELGEMFGAELQLYCYANEYSPGNWWLTIHHRRASKHVAMRSLVDRFAPSAQVVALGDNVNDLLMLEHADVAVAVENAVGELKALADVVIGHHDEDSVVHFLASDFRAERKIAL